MRNFGYAAALFMGIILAVPSVSGNIHTPAYAQSQTDISVWMNGSPLKLTNAIFVQNKTTMVPLREIAEALQAKVTWTAKSANRHIVTVSRDDRIATLEIGSQQLVANDRTIKLEVAPQLLGNVTMVPLRAISESLGSVVAWDGIQRIIRIDDAKQLPVVGTTAKLEQLLQSIQTHYGIERLQGFAVNEAGNAPTGTADSAESEASGAFDLLSGAGDDYSKTNTQVQGVDEADWAKTDGRFLYQLSGSRVLIADISDPSAPNLAATLEYNAEERFSPEEIYVDDKRLVVIGRNSFPAAHDYLDAPVDSNADSAGSSRSEIAIYPPMPLYKSTMQTKIYELNEAGQPKLLRETTLEGDYVTSRKIDSALYIITNKNNYSIEPLAQNYEPMYSDSPASDQPKIKTLPLSQVRYFPGSPDSSTLLIGALDLDRPDQEMQVSAYLGSGQTVYASTKHLYVAVAKSIADGDRYRQETQIFKFRLDNGNVVYIGEGSVPGTILNQFAMDEHDGYFRIATTKGNMWASGPETSTNNLYVLDEQMQTIGTLDNLAPGERIYSTRFMGKRAYMVTFRNVDPLFAIDLSNPTKPTVLGQLKIPGYSDYLHPYDEHHIIGFGKETIEVPSKGIGPDETMAFYQGMKMALFDVTDVSQPKEKFKEIIGDRGTSSELLYNHKALLFSRSKGLLAFPVVLMEIKDKDSIDRGGFQAYGEFTYQGAYIYHIDPDTGFNLRGRITHLSQDDMLKSGQYGFDYRKSVRRILYSGDTLYTLSESMLKTNDMNSLTERGSLAYPAPAEDQYSVNPGGPSIMPMPIPMPESAFR